MLLGIVLAAAGLMGAAAQPVTGTGAASPAFLAGVEAYRQKDPARAARLWREAAEAGDVNAQTNLGLLYETGTGVERDDTVALRWYQRAADAGFAHAQRQLGRYHYDAFCGPDAPQAASTMRALAATWYRKAADGGDNEARFRLGRMLLAGDCVSADRQAGVSLLTAAAQAGHVGSQSLLGRVLASSPDAAEQARGLEWLKVAADLGDEQAKLRLGRSDRDKQSRDSSGFGGGPIEAAPLRPAPSPASRNPPPERP